MVGIYLNDWVYGNTIYTCINLQVYMYNTIQYNILSVPFVSMEIMNGVFIAGAIPLLSRGPPLGKQDGLCKL